MCGGTLVPSVRAAPVTGLSPRVRGNRPGWHGRSAWTRSIPACAGEPALARIAPHTEAVYPRVCGGTRSPCPKRCIPEGLSPRVRGNRRSPSAARRGPGSIPACAGEPDLHAPSDVFQKVYPRVCGGTSQASGSRKVHRGLSPRVRGNRRRHVVSSAVARSIPACAGEPGQRC